MIPAILRTLAELSWRETVTSADMTAHYAPQESHDDLRRNILAQSKAAMSEAGDPDLNELLASVSDDELRVMLKEVEDADPNPYAEPPPSEFCMVCGARPDWWSSSTREEKLARGYKFVRYDEDPAEWQYLGDPAWCATCIAEIDEQNTDQPDLDDPWFGPPPTAEKEAEMNRHHLEECVTSCLREFIDDEPEVRW